MLRPFRLEEPQNLQEVSNLLAQFGESARIYAGGTELLLAMKEGLIHYERLINLKKVEGLNEIKTVDGKICLGALCTHHQLETSPLLKESLPALVELENHVANVRVRQAGTIGGNLCFAEPHADPGTLLIALGSTFIAEKAGSKREIPGEAFFVGAYETSLEADEILTEIHVPIPGQQTRAVYMKFGYLERPSVGLAIAVTQNGGHAITDVKIAVGCAGPAPKRILEAEELLKNKSAEEAGDAIGRAGEVAGRAADAISDLHGSQEYKEHIVGVLLKRAFNKALARST